MEKITGKQKFDKPIKATMILINSVGLPIIWHIWLKETYLSKKDYSKIKLVVYHRLKGKRKYQGRIMEQVAIGRGWTDITGAFNSKEKDGEFISFDDDAYLHMKKQLKNIIISTQ